MTFDMFEHHTLFGQSRLGSNKQDKVREMLRYNERLVFNGKVLFIKVAVVYCPKRQYF